MSWTRYYASAEEFRNNVPTPPANEAQESLEHRDQIKAAREAALAIIDSHAVGLKDVTVVLTGHANPGHEPQEGWSNDCISVNVNQK